MLRFHTPASSVPADEAQPSLVKTSAAPRIELHTSKVSKYLDVVFRYSLLICSLSIIAGDGFVFLRADFALKALDRTIRFRFFHR